MRAENPDYFIVVLNIVVIVILAEIVRRELKKIILEHEKQEEIWLLYEYTSILGENKPKSIELRKYLKLCESESIKRNSPNL